MVIVQTPLRVSLLGGGTDFPEYFRAEGGCVLTTAIDRHVFVVLKPRSDERLRVTHAEIELVEDASALRHDLLREALLQTGIAGGVDVVTMADIPSGGSGLGSSGAVTVGALHAMYAYRHVRVTPERLAREACEIEIRKLGRPIGVQDQVIAAHGGFRWLEFRRDGSIRVESVELTPPLRARLDESLLLFFTGQTRDAGEILKEQRSNIATRTADLRVLKELALEARRELVAGNLERLGQLLHEGWSVKRGLASRVSSGAIDEMYDAARRAGAIGGKISGAGGGGYLLLHCPTDRRPFVREALRGLRELPFRLEPGGSTVALHDARS